MGKGRKIYNMKYLKQEIETDDSIWDTQVTFRPEIELDRRNEAQNISNIEFVNKYGKIVTEIRAKTKISRNISNLPTNNFGSIIDYYSIDTAPKYFIRVKGTEITYITNEHKRWHNRFLLNRRFASKVLSFWAYLNNIRYKPSEGKESAIDIWCIPIRFNGSNKVIHLISIVEVKALIRDIIKEIRNHNPKAYYEFKLKVDKPKAYKYSKKVSENGENYIIWRFPKYSVEYLLKLLDILNSGEILDVYVPIVYDLYKYPIRCTDMNKTDVFESEKTTDDYDLTQYLIDGQAY